MNLDCVPQTESRPLFFEFITVPAKWVKTMRRYVLNIYIDDYAYSNQFKTDFG